MSSDASTGACSQDELLGDRIVPPGDFAATCRMLDANRNRAVEALRLIEDYCRFALNDAFLSASTKRLRHDLTAALQAVPAHDLLCSRETQLDVGTAISTAAE